MAKSQISHAEFEDLLIRALKRLGAIVIPRFRIPGTDLRLDLYIAFPVRAFVEIRLRDPPNSTDLNQLRQQLTLYRNQFADEIVPILVMSEKSANSLPTSEARSESDFHIITLVGPLTNTSTVNQCAQQIRNLLVHLPYRFKEETVEDWQFTDTDTFSKDTQDQVFELDHWKSSDVLRHLADELSVPSRSEPSEMADRMPSAAPMAAEDRWTTYQDVFYDVLISLKSVLNADEFQVLEQELESFSEEYRHQHYTACGLRIGRTLEHVVYALARAWGVNVNRATLQVLSGLNNSFEQLSQSIIQYAASEREQRISLKVKVQDQLETISSRLIRLIFDLDTDLRPENTDVPVNVESILRDMRKQFGRRTKVLNALNKIIDSQVIRTILDARNAAAHANTSGLRRELSRSEIDGSVELLRTALLLFGNVAFAVAEKDS